MPTMKILAFLLLCFIVYGSEFLYKSNGLRCHSNENVKGSAIDCPVGANDVCAFAYCGNPIMPETFWINNCISGFDKESACKALDEKFCNKPGKDTMNFDGCKICSKNQCNVYGFKDEPEWRKPNPTKTTPKHGPDQTTSKLEPVETTQIEPELVESTAEPAPITTKNEPKLVKSTAAPIQITTTKKKAETTTTTADDIDETNNAIYPFKNGYEMFFGIVFGWPLILIALGLLPII